MESQQTTFLVRAACRGDAAGLTALVERLDPLLRAQARYRLPGADVGALEDLVQDVWLRALPRLGDVHQQGGRRTPVLLRFLASVLLHRVQELVRARIRRGQDGPAVAEPIADAAGVVTRALMRERRDALWEHLAALPDEARELLVLRGIEQQDNQAVAARLGITANAASLRYNRLLAELRGRFRGSVLDEL